MAEDCRIVVAGTMRLFDENLGRHRGGYLLQTGLVVLTLLVLIGAACFSVIRLVLRGRLINLI